MKQTKCSIVESQISKVKELSLKHLIRNEDLSRAQKSLYGFQESVKHAQRNVDNIQFDCTQIEQELIAATEKLHKTVGISNPVLKASKPSVKIVDKEPSVQLAKNTPKQFAAKANYRGNPNLGKLKSKPEIYKGTEYPSRAEACRKLNVSRHSVDYYVHKRGFTFENAVDIIKGTIVAKKNPVTVKVKGAPFNFEGKMYSSLAACCESFDETVKSVYSKTSRERISHQQALREIINSRVWFEGKKYSSVASFEKAMKLPASSIRNIMRNKKMTAVQAYYHYTKSH